MAHGGSEANTYSANFIITQRKQVVVGAGLEQYWAAERYQLQGGVSFSKFRTPSMAWATIPTQMCPRITRLVRSPLGELAA